MKALLICPNDRPSAAFYTRQAPLALVPLLGRTALDRVLSRLARKGVHHVRILAADRPEEIREYVGGGKPWGVEAEVIPVPGDLSVDEAKGRYGWNWIVEAKKNDSDLQVVTMDTWPGDATTPLWENAAQWFDNLLSHIDTTGADSVGMREVTPGVWMSTRARVSSRATLIAPCWIGHNAWIGSQATIGPRAIVENDACIDEGAEVVDSHVGPATYVGSLTELRQSFAWGAGLLNWMNGSFVEVCDPLLLDDLGQQFRQRPGSSIIGRFLALLTLLLTWPIAAFAFLRANADGLPLFITHRGVRAPINQRIAFARTLNWSEMNGVRGLLRRWPQLWNIVRGSFSWVGNRPLNYEQAGELVSEYEHLWLHVPPGLISMADAEECTEPFGDVARAHAAFYAVHASRRLDLTLLLRVFKQYIPVTLFPSPPPPTIQPIHQA